MAGIAPPPSLARVRVDDLVPSEGIPSDSYKLAASNLTQSLAQHSAAIVQISPHDAALLRSCLDSARMYFHHHHPFGEMDQSNDSRDRGRSSSGYYADPLLWQEIFDYRPGITPAAPPEDLLEFRPSGLQDLFPCLAKVARHLLDAISFFLNLQSFSFSQMLDNVPLRSREISSSVLSVCCHCNPSFAGAQQHHDNSQMEMLPDHAHQVDKTFVTLAKSDREGLLMKDVNGNWRIVDGGLGPQEVVVYSGLALSQVTSSYINPAMYKIELRDDVPDNWHGHCLVCFKLMPRSTASLSCPEMREAADSVGTPFQMSSTQIEEFIPGAHSQECLTPKRATSKHSAKRRKPLPPSKRLRLEAQRVLKERVQEIADKKGIKLRFCNLKDCEVHIQASNSPCGTIRKEIGWPPGVPFVHPHDLPNKAKLGFLQAYEPDWMISQHDMENQST